MKYPKECPAFEIDGEHYEVCPVVWPYLTCGIQGVHSYEVTDALVYAKGNSRWFTKSTMKPLTPAARELLRWVRQ